MSERQRIARELHDNLDQGLAGIALQLDSSIKLFEKDPESGLAGMKKIQEMLIYCSHESRNTILELRGGWLESMDLKEAIIQFADQLMEQHTIKISVISEGNIQRLDRYVERQVFSIAKEAMTNACKHSNATEVIVKMKFSESRYELSLSDNGVGLINIDKDHKGHFGLLGMRERANRINGDLLIQPNDNSGARIKLTVSCE
jgi:signal transduction histidine kinase